MLLLVPTTTCVPTETLTTKKWKVWNNHHPFWRKISKDPFWWEKIWHLKMAENGKQLLIPIPKTDQVSISNLVFQLFPNITNTGIFSFKNNWDQHAYCNRITCDIKFKSQFFQRNFRPTPTVDIEIHNYIVRWGLCYLVTKSSVDKSDTVGLCRTLNIYRQTH